MRIFLVGYMGSGKTTLGRKLAARMGLEFADVDARIEAAAGKSIPDIFAQEGEKRFRKFERDALREIVAADHLVVATGGGLPCFHSNMDLMNATGITVYLRMSPAALAARLRSVADRRPVLGGRKGEELVSFITEHLAEREPYYGKAKLVANGLDADVDALTELLSASSP